MSERRLSGSSRSPRAVESDTSANRTVTVLRTSRAGSAGASLVPHSPQNFSPGRFSVPQAGQGSAISGRVYAELTRE